MWWLLFLKGDLLRAENPHDLILGIQDGFPATQALGKKWKMNPRTLAQSVCSYCLNWVRRVFCRPPHSQFRLNQCDYCGFSSRQFGADGHIQLSAIYTYNTRIKRADYQLHGLCTKYRSYNIFSRGDQQNILIWSEGWPNLVDSTAPTYNKC